MNSIGDYAVIGDCHSMALVGRDGSLDWACFPRFDSPAVFARILDADRGGHFAITPRAVRQTRRAYVTDTNVLVTRFTCAEGALEVTDCMPVAMSRGGRRAAVMSRHAILRRVHCTQGEAEVAVEVAPRFEYGTFCPRFRVTEPGRAEIVGGADALWVRSTEELHPADGMLSGSWRLRAGDEAWVEVAWTPSHEPPHAGTGTSARDELRRRLEETIAYWRGWMTGCAFEGEHEAAVRRSALTLKALTYAPSGAVIAAGTTSLPEELGGRRNWDYRYTWIRDATLTLISLFCLGFRDEADAFKWWLERTGAGRPEDLQVMYGICGERRLPELELAHLRGYRESAPVRIGNDASMQVQLDTYGQILEAAYLYAKAGGELTAANWDFLVGVADVICRGWKAADQGIWEMRDPPRHFLHSKLSCWLGLDRIMRLSIRVEQPGDVLRWRDERNAIRTAILDDATNRGWFSQALGTDTPDASSLLVPALGFLDVRHPLVQETVRRVRQDLAGNGLVRRYACADGLPGAEGAFLLCSFWLVDCLTHAGAVGEADELLGRLLGLANDVGLYSEEVAPDTGAALGNFPQAFTHMALVLSCSHLAAARRGQLPTEGAHNFAELALGRLLGARVPTPADT